eukprot:4433956-Pleurochrysis_carterae.AAC.1
MHQVSSVEQQIQAVNGKLSRVESRLKEIEASWITKIFGFWILSDQEKVLLEAEKKLLLEEKKMLLEEKQALLEEKKLRRESAGASAHSLWLARPFSAAFCLSVSLFRRCVASPARSLPHLPPCPLLTYPSPPA